MGCKPSREDHDIPSVRISRTLEEPIGTFTRLLQYSDGRAVLETTRGDSTGEETSLNRGEAARWLDQHNITPPASPSR